MYVLKECDEQVVCWNCEEMVHESALQCPYCNTELKKHSLEKVPSQKITPLVPYAVPKQQAVEENASSSSGTFSFICSLFLFLAGSSFLLLAAMIILYAKDGFFTISWHEHSASAFLGLGMSAIAFGTLFLQRVSRE